MRRVLLVLLVVGCSSSEPASPPANDAAPSDVALDTPVETSTDAGFDTGELPACGEGPWVIESGNVVLQGLDGSTTPKGGIQVTPSLCPDKAQTTPPDGKYGFRISKGKPLSIRYEGEGVVTQIRGEYAFTSDSTTGTPTMLPVAFYSILPDWGAGKAAIFVTTRASGSGACASPEGLSISVEGHPEAKITYYSETTPPTAVPGATGMTKSGMAAVTGVAPGVTVKLLANKSGCTATFARPPRTGNGPLVADVVTMMSAYVMN